MTIGRKTFGALGFAALMITVVVLVGWRLLADREADSRNVRVDAASVRYAPPVESGSAAATPLPAKGTDRVYGTVRNARGEAVEGATVSLLDDDRTLHDRHALTEAGRLASSDDRGEFTVAWPAEAAQPGLVLSTRHPQYIAQSRSLAAAPGEPIDIVLEDGQSLAGTVVLLDDRTPARGVRIVARGVSAPYSAAQTDRVPQAAAVLQEAVTDERGAFALRGLPDGWYQIDVIAPGLTVVPKQTMKIGRDLAFIGSRSVVARAGAAPVRIRVGAIAVIAVRVTNARSGHAVPLLFVSLFMPEGVELIHAGPLSGNSEVALLSGHTYNIHPVGLPQGVHARYAVSASYPIPADAQVGVKVVAPGYESLVTSLPLAALGAKGGIPLHEIAVKPLLETGGVRFRLHDRKGTPVQHVLNLVPQLIDGPPAAGAISVRFDSKGEGEPIALPVGTYAVRVAGTGKWDPVEPVNVEVRPGIVAVAPLTLRDFGGFDLTVVDERNVPVDDFGVTTALGHQPIEVTADTECGEYVVRGLPVLVPGLGRAWRGQVVGYPDGPVTIEVTRHGYRPQRILTEARAGEIRPLRVVLEAAPAARWRER